MIAFLMIVMFAAMYAMVGGTSLATYEALSARKCNIEDHNYSKTWCGHTCVALWIAGILWPVGLPALAGSGVGWALGSNTREKRTEKRYAREIAEATHAKELERINAEADAELDRRLALATKDN